MQLGVSAPEAAPVVKDAESRGVLPLVGLLLLLWGGLWISLLLLTPCITHLFPTTFFAVGGVKIGQDRMIGAIFAILSCGLGVALLYRARWAQRSVWIVLLILVMTQLYGIVGSIQALPRQIRVSQRIHRDRALNHRLDEYARQRTLQYVPAKIRTESQSVVVFLTAAFIHSIYDLLYAMLFMVMFTQCPVPSLLEPFKRWAQRWWRYLPGKLPPVLVVAALALLVIEGSRLLDICTHFFPIIFPDQVNEKARLFDSSVYGTQLIAWFYTSTYALLSGVPCLLVGIRVLRGEEQSRQAFWRLLVYLTILYAVFVFITATNLAGYLRQVDAMPNPTLLPSTIKLLWRDAFQRVIDTLLTYGVIVWCFTTLLKEGTSWGLRPRKGVEYTGDIPPGTMPNAV